MDGVRLDGPTMRHVAKSLRVGLESVRADLGPDAEAFVKCIEDMAAEADDVAEQAESRPPLLSDWVRAVEAPFGGDVSWDTRGEYLVAYLDGGHHVSTVPFGSKGADLDDEQHFDSPAELRAALDRLAAEALRRRRDERLRALLRRGRRP